MEKRKKKRGGCNGANRDDSTSYREKKAERNDLIARQKDQRADYDNGIVTGGMREKKKKR